MSRPADAVVIGAGIQGLSAAYHLAQHGLNVVVLEREADIGRGSSGRSGSMLMKSRENRAKIALSLYSFEWFAGFLDRFGEPLWEQRCGFLSVVPPALAHRYEQEHVLRLEMGVPSQRLELDDVASLAPAVCLDGIAFGVHCPDDRVIDPVQILRAYADGLRHHGGEIRLGHEVLDLLIEGNHVRGAMTSQGPVEGGWTVDAAGTDGNRVLTAAGVQMPLANRRRSLYRIAASDPALQKGPMVEDAGSEWYFRGLGNGTVLVGMGLESGGQASDDVDWELLPHVEEEARRRVPSLAGAKILGGTSGFRPLTPDTLPIVGSIPGLDHLVLSVGWGGEGIMHSPAGGALVANCVLGDGTVPLGDDLGLDQFSPTRFL